MFHVSDKVRQRNTKKLGSVYFPVRIRELQPYSKSRIKVALEPSSDVDIVISTEKSADFKRWLVGEHA
jgi:hypothetical protein